MKALAEALGRDLSIIYRWRKSLIEGRGIKDANKRALIAATAHGANPITWADFMPEEQVAA